MNEPLPKPRPSYKYGVRTKHTAELDAIEDWLKANCEGGYEFHFDQVACSPHARGLLDIVFQFERKSDRAKFKEMLLRRPVSKRRKRF